jgi:hypothetical protein
MKDESLHEHDHDQQGIQAMVDYQGFALFHGANDHTAWTHTIGLARPGTQRPEFLVSGGIRLFRIHILLSFGFEVNGPPSHAALLDESHARGIPLRELWYPSGGRSFEPGRIYRRVQGIGRPCCLGQVDQQYYQTFLWHAIAYHGNRDFPAFQVVVSASDGTFPWERTTPVNMWSRQELLFDPHQYLPLWEEKA